MLWDGSRRFQDDPKDHPEFFFGGSGINAFEDAPRWLKDVLRWSQRPSLSFFPSGSANTFEDGSRWPEDGPKDHPRLFS